MSLIPVDKRVEEEIAKRARETGQSKSEILQDIITRATGEERRMSPDEERYERLRRMPAPTPDSLGARMKDYLETMMMAKIMSSMNTPQAAPASSMGEDMKTIFMIKQLTQPGFYEIMLMQRMGEGGEAPKWLETLANEQKETRVMMQQLLGVKQQGEQMAAVVAPIVDQMTKDRETMVQNTQAILSYIQQGETAGPGSLEGMIANALKTRLVDEAMDAIDRGLFQRKEIVTPEGGFSWKGILDRMMAMGEELIKKMPSRQAAPGLMPIRTREGYYMHPTTGQHLTAEQAQVMIQAATMQVPAVAPLPVAPTPETEVAPPTPSAPTQPAQSEQIRKKKTEEAVDVFMSAGEPTGAREREETPSEPTGN